MAEYVPSLRKKYKDEVVSKLMEQFQYSTIMQVPKIKKISLNQGVGQATQDKKLVEHALKEMTMIACLLYTSPSPRDRQKSRMPSSA